MLLCDAFAEGQPVAAGHLDDEVAQAPWMVSETGAGCAGSGAMQRRRLTHIAGFGPASHLAFPAESLA